VADSGDGSATFLFTDIEGSTRLLKALGDRYPEVLAEHQRLLRRAFVAHGGREVDTQGDAFFVVFPTPRDAVAASIRAQRALRDHAWPDGVEVRVRIGMDTGAAALAQERYTGHAVHRAARISAAGHGGQILLSDTSERSLPERDGFSLRDLGPRRLKDIDERVRVYQVVAPGLQRQFPALKTVDVVRRRRLQLTAALAVAAAAAAAALVLVLGGSPAVEVAPDSVGVIDPAKNRVTAQLPVGRSPGSLASGYGSVWVANAGDKTVSHVDAFTRSVVKTIPVPGTPDSVAVGPGAVWVLHGLLGELTRIDPDVNDVARTIQHVAGRSLAGGGGALAVGGGAVWAAFSSATVAKIDPASDRVVARDVAGRSPAGAAFGSGSLWVANRSQNTVYRFAPGRFGRGPAAVVAVGRGPSAVALGGGYVWVSNTDDDSVSRIDPATNKVTRLVVGGGPDAIAYGAGAVWVADGDGTVARLDPRTGDVKARIHVGNRPAGIAVVEGRVWVSVDAR
jgi:YVTN family beta-propeller protein